MTAPILLPVPPAPIAIQVEELEKTFRTPVHRVSTLKERALHPFRRNRFDERRVLDDVSFKIASGEFFGIVGRNGSGKSTLLKCLAGIYRADSGSIRIAGRLSPFIELGVGFNPDLTARDNVTINAVMMGLTPKEARGRFDDIIAFAELERFVDLKLKNYSSGMQVRLAFSVMVQTDADVLLIDEVLAVGDAAFQQKCFDVFLRLRDEGKTVVLVTHEMGLVERFCHRALLLSGGRIDMIGDPTEVGRAYLAENFGDFRTDRFAQDDDQGAPVHLLDVWISDDANQRVDSIAHGAFMRLHAVFEAHAAIASPAVALWVTTAEGTRAFAMGAREGGAGLADLDPGEHIEVTVEIGNPLATGRYFVGCSMSRGSTAADILVISDRAAEFLVYGGDHVHALVALHHTVEVERGHATLAP